MWPWRPGGGSNPAPRSARGSETQSAASGPAHNARPLKRGTFASDPTGPSAPCPSEDRGRPLSCRLWGGTRTPTFRLTATAPSFPTESHASPMLSSLRRVRAICSFALHHRFRFFRSRVPREVLRAGKPAARQHASTSESGTLVQVPPTLVASRAIGERSVVNESLPVPDFGILRLRPTR